MTFRNETGHTNQRARSTRWESRPGSHRDVVPWTSSLIERTFPLVDGDVADRPIRQVMGAAACLRVYTPPFVESPKQFVLSCWLRQWRPPSRVDAPSVNQSDAVAPRRACAHIAVVPTTSKDRNARFPIFEILSNRSLPPVECIFGRRSTRQNAGRGKCFGIGDQGDNRCCGDRAYARNCIQSSHCVIAPNLGNYLVFQCGYTLGAPRSGWPAFGAPSGQRREAGRSLVANDTDQRLDPFPAPLAAMIASSPR